MLIRPDAAVDAVTVWNDLPGHAVDGAIMVELGDLWAGEERRLVLMFAVPAGDRRGARRHRLAARGCESVRPRRRPAARYSRLMIARAQLGLAEMPRVVLEYHASCQPPVAGLFERR